MNETQCINKIATDFNVLGVQPGETIIVHSSYKSLGPVPGGIETIIRGLLQAIGEQGTLVMPALSWALRPPEIFDIAATPTNVGAIPEYFRTRPGTARSLHPTHSVCAVGPRAEELLADHEKDSTPCGENSPFHKIAETHGKIIMLGCGLKPNTTMHALEEYVEPPYLFGETCTFTIRDVDGKIFEKQYRTHGFSLHGYTQRYDKVADLDHEGFLRHGNVLKAATNVIDSPGLKDAVLKQMADDQFFFVESIDVQKI